MKSIKPGRGPSAMGAVGAVIAVIFGIFWTAMAVNMGAPVFFPIFGVLFIIMGIIQGVYNYKNATGKNRYSAFDIVDSGEEPDPLQARFGEGGDESPAESGRSAGFCPYCGAGTEDGFRFCRSCGRKLPEDK